MSNKSSVRHFLPLSSLKFSPLLLLEEQILVNKHASNPAKNVLLSTGSPLLRTQKASFKDLARPFLPVMHLWGTSPGPNLLSRLIQQCQDWRSDLSGDRCVYMCVLMSGRWVHTQMPQTSFDFASKMTGKVLYYSAASVCLFVCIRKEADLNARASVCLDMHVFLLLMSVCVCHG